MKKKKKFSFFDLLVFLIIGGLGGIFIYFYGYTEYQKTNEVYLEQHRRFREEQRRNQELRVRTQALREYIREKTGEDIEFDEDIIELD